MLKITKKKYKTNLTIKEINTINLLRSEYDIFEKTRLNMMSVLSYLVKHGAGTDKGFRKSFNDLWNMYKRYHKNIKSISNFKKIIYKLEEYKLIFIEKVGKINVYYNSKFLEVKDKESEEVTKKKTPENTDMTSVEDGQENTQIQSSSFNIYNNIYNTPNGLSTGSDYKNSEAYKKACEEKDYLAPVELMNIAYKILKEGRRKSEILISMIRKALMDKMEINRLGAYNYVRAVVAEKVAKYEFNREMYALAIAKNKNNYRLAYNKANSTFANFTQRSYDYDKLEKQLLGLED